MNIEVDYKEPNNSKLKEELKLEDEIGDLIEKKPQEFKQVEKTKSETSDVDENTVFRENLAEIRCVLLDETNYKAKKGSLKMIENIFNECVQYNIPQAGCVLIGLKRNEACYLHFRINPGKPSYLTLRNCT